MYTQHLFGAKKFGTLFAALLIALMVFLPLAPVAYAEDIAPPPPAEETPPPPPEAPPAPDPTPEPAPAPEQQTLTEETQTQTQENTPPEAGPGENGASGGNGQNGGEDEPNNDGTPGGPAVIDTGDAAAISDTQNEANTNDLSVPSNASTTASSTNNAEVTNGAGADAGTGGNVATGSGGASISTGDAIAAANVINVLNTNIINSFGIFAFLNALFGGGFDLRDMDLSYFFGSGANGSCSLMSCANGTLTIGNANNASTTNNMNVTANSGANIARSGGEGDAYIGTGDAYAAGNLINVINTNIVNSNYLLIAANNFGDLIGDITLPSADFFMQLLASRAAGLSGNTTVSNTNDASVTNDVTAGASSGSNTATTGDGSALIQTGDANALANTYNQVNSNLIGGTTFYMLINVLGDWSGEVTGLPPGITWARTPTGIVLMADEGAGMPSSGGCCGGTLNVNNDNSANVTNNVQVYALTGDNYAEAESGTAGIQTGDAYAAANVVNMVNTNVIGQNWLFAIFNIFGNWDGNLSFGRPDLWIGGVAETPNPTAPGSEVTYRFTVANFGDADATNVKLSALFDTDMLSFGTDGEGGAEWNLGNIPKGQTRDFYYTARAGQPSGEQLLPVPLEATVSSTETDENPEDNTERLSIVISSLDPEFGYSRTGTVTPDPKITIKKTASVSTTTLPATVDYTVVVRNNGGEVYNGLLEDTLTGPDGEIIYQRSWDLYTVKAGEELTLTYTIEFKNGTLPGLYKNTAEVRGLKNNSKEAFATGMDPVKVTNVIELLKGDGKVLGVSSAKNACAEYITAYIKPGAKNDPDQVKRLEYFLRDYEGASISPDGVYDAKTIAAVKAFQEKYAVDVLGPWGIGDATGNVYYTTKKAINEVRCTNIARTKFPLSEKQQNEILAFKSGLNLSSYLAKKKTETKVSAAPAPVESNTIAETETTEVSSGAGTPAPENENLQRTPAIRKTPNMNAFESLFNLFKGGQAMFKIPTAEAYYER